MSASSKPTLQPICFNAKARLVAKVDFPTPPFALEIAMVNFVPRIGFFQSFFGFLINHDFINTKSLSLLYIGENRFKCSL